MLKTLKIKKIVVKKPKDDEEFSKTCHYNMQKKGLDRQQQRLSLINQTTVKSKALMEREK